MIPSDIVELLTFSNFIDKVKDFFLAISDIFSRIFENIRDPSKETAGEETKKDEVLVDEKESQEAPDKEKLGEDKEDQIAKEEVGIEETEKEEIETSSSAPTIDLRIIEGPLYSEEDEICFYRVEAVVSGQPSPSIEFSRDDSNGAWGEFIAQVNLNDPSDTYTLKANATNSEGKASDAIEFSWGCPEDPGEAPDLTTLVVEFHPSDVGHIIQHLTTTHMVDTSSVLIGDSRDNTNIRGYFAFDLSSLAGKEIVSASLVLETYILHGDPSFKDYIGLRWGTYLPLEPEDYLMLGTHPVTIFDNLEEPIEFIREDLNVAIYNSANVFNQKLQFALGYSNEASNGDLKLDGREYRSEDITLTIEYRN
jgi:hypothetical protein